MVSVADLEAELELAVLNVEEFLASIGSREPTEDEEDMLTELQELVTDFEEQLDELREQEVDPSDFNERRERLIGNNPGMVDGEIDSWERWSQDYK